MEENGNSEALSKIVINGQEYDPAEAQEFIETGRKTREYEQKYNTSLDKVWPEYTRISQERKQLETELNDARAKLDEVSKKQQEGSETPTDVAQAREAARKLGIVFDEDLGKAGYIRKEDLPGLFQSFQQEQQAVQNVLKEADKLESEINGSDGRPKFNKKAVMAYASAYGFTDLAKAYEDMNEEALKPWKEAQVAAARKKSLQTLEGTKGNKSPKSPKINDDNVGDMLREALSGSSEE